MTNSQNSAVGRFVLATISDGVRKPSGELHIDGMGALGAADWLPYAESAIAMRVCQLTDW